jgi:deltex
VLTSSNRSSPNHPFFLQQQEIRRRLAHPLAVSDCIGRKRYVLSVEPVRLSRERSCVLGIHLLCVLRTIDECKHEPKLLLPSLQVPLVMRACAEPSPSAATCYLSSTVAPEIAALQDCKVTALGVVDNGNMVTSAAEHPIDGQALDLHAFIEKARAFALLVQANHRRLLTYDRHAPDMNANNFALLSQETLVGLATKLFATQDTFRRQGKAIHVDIGYHYTKTESLENICKKGLLSKAERHVAKIASASNGETFGDGVYTSANPFSYHKFKGGDQGLFVARIQGRAQVGLVQEGDASTLTPDTIIGRHGMTDEVWVLQSSAQSVPLVKFSADLVELDNDAGIGNNMVYMYHGSLQRVIDECFNSGAHTPVTMFLPSQVNLRGYGLTRVVTFHQVIEYKAPDKLCATEQLVQVDPKDVCEEVECSICLSDLRGHGTVIRLPGCSHQFHQACAQMVASNTSKCPNCRAPISSPQGKMPSGTMQILVRSDLACKGHEKGTIAITYEISGGIQKEYHENPGQSHQGTIRSAFIPDCAKGRQLLRRLKFAFQHGLTFTVGTSLSSGRANAVTWASIHHKTRLDMGAHGYPDPCYFANANEELDVLRVPAADDLPE